MKKELTKKDYNNYMEVVNQNIKETERRLKTLDKSKKVSQLSFEDWVKDKIDFLFSLTVGYKPSF